MTRTATAFGLLVCLLFQVQAPAQIILRRDPNQPDLTIDGKMVKDVIEAAIKNLNEAYVFPETAAKIDADLRKRLETKEYDGVSSAKKLAELLTNQMQAISNDKHLRVNYHHDRVPEMPRPEDRKPGTAKESEMHARMLKRGARLILVSKRSSVSRGTSAI